MHEETTAAGDEETFVLPAAWHRQVFVRRGGIAGSALTRDAGPGEELTRAADIVIGPRLNNPASDTALVAAAQEWLADPASASPAGAGVVAGLICCNVGWGHEHELVKVADAWVALRGVAFAAQAVVLTTGLDFGGHWSNGRQIEPRLIHRGGPGWGYFPHWLALAGRVRAHLAHASDDDYAAAQTALESLRSQSLHRRVATSFLLPTQRSWVEADIAAVAGGGDNSSANVLWCSVSTPEQVAALAPFVEGWWVLREPVALATAADGAGKAIVPQLVAWLDLPNISADLQQRLLGMLTHFPADEAMGGLIARLDRKYVPVALLEAARRFPRRALRLLASDNGRAAYDMLRAHVLANRELVTQEQGLLPPQAQARVEAILAEATSVPTAPPQALPQVLVTPPWKQATKAAKPVVVSGLEFTGEAMLAWAPGEQEQWAAKQAPHAGWWQLPVSVEVAAKQHREGKLAGHHQVTLMLTGPPELVEPILPGWQPDRVWDAAEWMPQIVARYGLLALPTALRLAEALPASCTVLLLPFANAEVAARMADALARLKSLRSVASSWLERHHAYAAKALVPQALGKAGAARRAAEEALRFIAAKHRDEVMAAAGGYGPQAKAGLEALLGADPLHMFPARIPALPTWAEPGLLPRILLADKKFALGDDAVRHLCTMLAISKPGDVYAGVPLVRDLCDRRSLAEFAWTLFTQWQTVGAPPKESWPLHALRWVGDDDTVRRLSPVIRAWPGEGGHAKALIGLDILADLGTDLALMHLNGIAQKAKFKGLKDRANEKVAEVAAGLGLTSDELADRLVPDLGLEADGSLTLDYGPRRFVVGFDEQLKPYVADESGARRKDLPKPGARDDEQLAPAAFQRFSGLKKDVRTIASDQIRRLEAAMVAGRSWSAVDFRAYLVSHPLLWHIVRRLVWSAAVDGGAPAGFRVAEDRSFADVSDDAYDLPAEAVIRLPHPLELGDAAAAWSEVFADYEILQPFPQLGRSVYELTEEEKRATELARFAGLKVPTTTVIGLERRGWRRGEPQDAGIQGWMWRATPDGRAVVIDLDPGIPIGALDIFPDQQITTIWVNGRASGDWLPQLLTRKLGDLDAVTASEVLRDLTEVLTR